jgi:hypothetical protein
MKPREGRFENDEVFFPRPECVDDLSSRTVQLQAVLDERFVVRAPSTEVVVHEHNWHPDVPSPLREGLHPQRGLLCVSRTFVRRGEVKSMERVYDG